MSSYKQATGKSIQEAFEIYHTANPKVYNELKRMALQAINKGKSKISFKLITNVLRWEIFMKTEEKQSVQIEGKKVTFKINDAYHSRYARLFADEYPDHKGKVDFRALRD